LRFQAVDAPFIATLAMRELGPGRPEFLRKSTRAGT
jgi:hypothetical protein